MTLEQAISVLKMELSVPDEDFLKILEDTLTKVATAAWSEGYAEGVVNTQSEGDDL